MKKLLLFLSLLTCVACTTLIDDIDPASLGVEQPKLVLYSIISPQDTAVNVYVSISTPLGYAIDTAITNLDNLFNTYPFVPYKGPMPYAQVSITDGTVTKQLTYNDQQGFYQVKLNRREQYLVAGGTYTITASYKNLTCTGSTTIPDVPQKATSLSISEEVLSNFYNDTIYTFNLNGEVVLSPNNSAYQKIEASITTSVRDLGDDTRYVIGNLFNMGDFGFIKNETSQDIASAFRGISVQFASGSGVVYPGELDWANSQINEVFLKIHNIDKNYYKYITTAFADNDNPFAEVTLVYSNVSSGMGVVGSRNSMITRYEYFNGELFEN